MGEEIRMVSELWKGGDVMFAKGNIIQDNKENSQQNPPLFFDNVKEERG